MIESYIGNLEALGYYHPSNNELECETTGHLSKVSAENGLGYSTMAYTIEVLPGGIRQKDRRAVDYQLLDVKDTP